MSSIHSQGSRESDGTMPILKEIRNKEDSKPAKEQRYDEEEQDNKSVEGLTFEKRKVIPQRRTQSQQSMLSSISLRSMIQEQQQMHRNSIGGTSNTNAKNDNNSNNNNNNIVNNNTTNNRDGNGNMGQEQIPNSQGPPNISHSLLNISQQIRSPAMFSIKRNGSMMQTSRKLSTGSSLRTRSFDSNAVESDEIGKKMPFTNDERVDVRRARKDKQQRSPLKSNIEENEQEKGIVGSHETNHSVLTEGKVDDDEEISQKNLTTQALRKLSNFKAHNVKESFKDSTMDNSKMDETLETTPVPEFQIEKTTFDNNNNSNKTRDSTPTAKHTNSDLNNPNLTPKTIEQSSSDTSRTSSNNILNFTTASKTMTHMKFGDKNIMIDNSADLPNSGSNQNLPVMASKNNSHNNSNNHNKAIQRIQSTDMLQKPARHISHNNGSNLQYSNMNRRNIKQLKNPKKPLYVPVVLRDVAETNLTNEDLEEVTPKIIRHNLPVARTRNTEEEELGSQKSLRSNGSSVIESYRKYISSLIFSSKNDQNNDSASSALQQRNFTPSTMGSYSSSIISMSSRSPQLPTRRHWVPDSKRSACHQCHKIFTFFERKHHCRHCGDIFCQKHLRHWLYLDSDAKFVIGGGGVGTLSKVCDNCHLEYEDLARTNLTPAVNIKGKKGLKSITSKVGNRENIDPMSLDSTLANQSTSKPIIVKRNEVEESKNKNEQENLNSVVGSVPADWNWSSF